MKLHLNVDYVDLITEPGPDKALAVATDATATVFKKVRFSASAHNPVAVAIAGHHDCIANPVSKEEHLVQIKDAVRIIIGWGIRIRTIGLWVNEWNWVDVVHDTDGKMGW
jgi:hypothetical protein